MISRQITGMLSEARASAGASILSDPPSDCRLLTIDQLIANHCREISRAKTKEPAVA